MAGGLLGTWIVLRGLAFYAHAVGTAAFPGLVLADGLGFAAAARRAGATAALFAVAVGARAPRGRARPLRRLTALVLVGALAVGVILASDVFHSGRQVETLLFGSLLSIDGGDLAFAARQRGVVARRPRSCSARAGWPPGFDPRRRARARRCARRLPDLAPARARRARGRRRAVGARRAAGHGAARRPGRHDAAVCRAPRAVAARHRRARRRRGRRRPVAVGARPTRRRARRSPCSPARVFARRRRWRASLGRVAAGRAAAAVGALALLAGGCGERLGAPRAARSRSSRPRPSSATSPATSAATRVDVHQILQPNTDPHDYEPRPERRRGETAGADVVLAQRRRASTTGWTRSSTQAGGDPRVVDLGASVPVKLAGESAGAEASRYDPHWWHDPRNAQAAVAPIRDALTAADPGAGDVYARNAARLPGRGCARSTAASPAACAACRRRSASSSPTTTPSATSRAATASRSSARDPLADAPRPSRRRATSPGSRASSERERVQGGLPRELGQRQARPGDRARRPARRPTTSSTATRSGPRGSSGATYLTMERANADAMVRGFTGGSAGMPDRRDLSDADRSCARRAGRRLRRGAGARGRHRSPLHAGRARRRAGPQRRRQDDAVPRAARRARAAWPGRCGAPARFARRAADRALAARLPGQRARRRADGHVSTLPWWRRPGRARAPRARAAALERGRAGASRPTRPSATCPAASASACWSRARWCRTRACCCSTSRSPASTRRAPSGSRRCSTTLAARGPRRADRHPRRRPGARRGTACCASTAARSPSGRPRPRCTRDVLEATYGGEIVELPGGELRGGRCRPTITTDARRAAHAHRSVGRADRAARAARGRAARRRAAARWAAGSSSTGSPTAPSRWPTGCSPAWSSRRCSGIPLLLGGAGGPARRGAGDRARRPACRPSAATPRWRSWSPRCSALGVLLALSPDSPPGLQSLLFGDVLGVTDADLVAGRRAGRASSSRALAAAARAPAGRRLRPPQRAGRSACAR